VREAATLSRLHAGDASGKLAPFLPKPAGSLSYASPPDAGQQANVFTYHPEITSPEELYSLEEVRVAYPDGVDARDVAWMWRRLLTVLVFVHELRTMHTAVTPDHVLIEPRGHKLVLVGWCGAVRVGERSGLDLPPGYAEWRRAGEVAAVSDDVNAAAKTMSYLLGAKVEPAVARHLERAADSTSVDAARLLDDFDRMIEALWGPRRFRAFTMPPRAAAARA
jgi:hypothetical protein